MVVDEFGREVPAPGASAPDYDEPQRGWGGATSSGGGRRRRRSSPLRYRSSSPPSRQEDTTPKRFRHAVERYMDAPMLCQYLWERQQQQEEEGPQQKQGEQEGTEAVKTENEEAGDMSTAQEQVHNTNNVNDKGEENAAENKDDSYDAYRNHYCLKYVRSFFNEHLDDSWFRNRYSPLGQKQAAQEEADRAAREAQLIRDEIVSSLESSHDSNDEGTPCSFVLQARLGEGQKKSDSGKKRKYEQDEAEEEDVVPKSHVLSSGTDKALICIREIPPHVTDEQLHHAVMDHCSVEGATVKVYSSSVTYNSKKSILSREAYAVCDSAEIRLDVLNNLCKANYSARRISSPPHHSGDIPRKDEKEAMNNTLPKFLDLDVICSDPYGRFEIDHDGNGGAPTSEDGVAAKVPPRRATVEVKTTVERQPTIVLSAAVSCKERIDRDKEAAVMLGRARDVARSIPRGLRLDDLLDLLFPQDSDNEGSHEASDILDVSVAYLRRVHLFSFYKGCTRASSLGDVLARSHPAGTIHLRLKGADELLRQSRQETEEMYGDLDEANDDTNEPVKDLLVMRLDDSIDKALEQSNEWVAHAGESVLEDETADREATEIEEKEESAKAEWIMNHCIVDADKRARCSFHFCRKLFKDKNFLQKHLIKKHGEFLRAEVAKCHDAYMMKSWDRESNRPVPPVLVDCGAKFGLVLSGVTGAEQPTASDPEPELWRKEQERRKRLEEEEERYNWDHHHHHQHRRGEMDDRSSNPVGADGMSEDHHRGGGNFVDVDDVKVEKVELSFENVEVPAQPPKKKKKRKKLL